ncbi:MAG: hypothetical protein EOO16_04705 [Chitinophagaceae bacterium]|nr:MAG: hypothetical protein EOO16_04705 [Chitinophagaceae bacterium]
MSGTLFQWLRDLQGFELVLWCIALFFSVLFVLQSVVSLFVGDGDFHHHDGGLDGDGGSFFTIKNMIAFFTMFGWAALASYHAGLGPAMSTVLGLGAGCGLVAILWSLLKRTDQMKHDGTLQMKNAIHKVGETYLRIPASRGGMGKVQVQVQGRLMELDAMTDDATDIATGRPIQVVNLLNNQILLVTTKLHS